MDLNKIKIVRDWLKSLKPPSNGKDAEWISHKVEYCDEIAHRYGGWRRTWVHKVAEKADPRFVLGLEHQGETIVQPYCSPGFAPVIQKAIVAELTALIGD